MLPRAEILPGERTTRRGPTRTMSGSTSSSRAPGATSSRARSRPHRPRCGEEARTCKARSIASPSPARELQRRGSAAQSSAIASANRASSRWRSLRVRSRQSRAARSPHVANSYWSNAERAAALAPWIDHYNHGRLQTSAGRSRWSSSSTTCPGITAKTPTRWGGGYGPVFPSRWQTAGHGEPEPAESPRGR